MSEHVKFWLANNAHDTLSMHGYHAPTETRYEFHQDGGVWTVNAVIPVDTIKSDRPHVATGDLFTCMTAVKQHADSRTKTKV